MKHIFFTFILLSFLLVSCDPIQTEPINYSDYKPLLMTKEKLRNSIAFEAGKDLQQPGKIYFKDNYIFISEQYKGVHIINNKNPENPENLAFIQVPGCLDMAVKGNILYVDNAVDLVGIDISDINSPKVVSRVQDILPEILTPDGGVLQSKYGKASRPENTVVVGWEKI
ncbi:MAG: hypothetical protein EOP53_03760 [Sphingobacteriales bacterium]|nr:MAG: hypothetical protein EOP53_03760 [Sphingobacteriales bacterium]